MAIRILTILLLGFTFSSCNKKGKYYDPNKKDTVTRTYYKADSVSALPGYSGGPLPETDLQLFCNREMVPYCIWLPLNDFKEDFSDLSTEKAAHKFRLRLDSASLTSIELQGFIIDKNRYYKTGVFFERDKQDVEEGGLGIDTAYMNEAKHFYVIKGHLPNYNNIKFVQLNWILEDRVAAYFNYDEKDSATWNKRIDAILSRGLKTGE